MLKIKNMNSNNVIRQGDSRPREYQLDTGNLNLNLANKQATIRLMTGDYKGIAYETNATVSSENKISFSIDDIIPAREYRLEITVDDYVFPSRALDGQFNVDPSSHGQEVNIINVIGKDEIVREVKARVENELEPLVTSLESAQQSELDRQAQEEVRVGAESTRELNEQTRLNKDSLRDGKIAQMEADKDAVIANATVDSEVILARGGKATLGQRLDETTAQLAQTNREVDYKLGLKADQLEFSTVKSQIDSLIAHAGDTDGNAELLDLRVATGGAVHDTAGSSVRYQIDKVEKLANDGVVGKSKKEVKSEYPTYKDGYVIFLAGSIGKTLEQCEWNLAGGSRNYLIDVSNLDQITYPVFKSTVGYGSLFIDDNDVVLWHHAEKDLETGAMKTVAVPPLANKFVLTVSTTLETFEWGIEYETKLNNRLKKSEGTPIKMVKSILIRSFPVDYTGNFTDAVNSVGKNLTEVNTSGGSFSTVKIDVSGFVAIDYPVFKSTGGWGSLIVNDQGVVIWQHSETVEATGTLKRVILPKGSKTFLLSVSRSLNQMDFQVNLYHSYTQKMLQGLLLVDEEEDDTNGVTSSSDLALCAIRTEIKDDKIPFHSGYLFHSLKHGDESLYLGSRMTTLEKIGEVGFSTNNSMLAISPKDNRVIATERGIKGELYVWDGTQTHILFDSTTGPKGWLYNSGVEFVNDESGIEHCIFAEYGGDVTVQTGGFYVWRGVYPYTSEANWEKVLFQDYAGTDGIGHFHMVRRDPFTNITYLTSGDTNIQSKWWYSLDFGKTWNLIATGATSGFEAHVMRCINFIFTEDYIYWAVDHGVNHSLNRMKRNSVTGVVDLSTRHKLIDLPVGQATNSITYVEYPKGLFMFDRWDYGPAFEQYFNLPIKVQFWDIEREQLLEVTSVVNRNAGWGGHRGQTYTNYTNSYNPYPAIGFSDDTRNPFEMPIDNPSQLGTIYYNVSEGLMSYLD